VVEPQRSERTQRPLERACTSLTACCTSDLSERPMARGNCACPYSSSSTYGRPGGSLHQHSVGYRSDGKDPSSVHRGDGRTSAARGLALAAVRGVRQQTPDHQWPAQTAKTCLRACPRAAGAAEEIVEGPVLGAVRARQGTSGHVRARQGTSAAWNQRRRPRGILHRGGAGGMDSAERGGNRHVLVGARERLPTGAKESSPWVQGKYQLYAITSSCKTDRKGRFAVCLP
jgi:hypothetical protein